MNLARQWHDDSKAAVSNVEPNAVAPNSKDKTNHPSSGIAPSKMAEGNLNEEREKFVLFKTILNARRQRRRMQQSILNTVIARRGLLLKVFSFILLLVSLDESQQVTVLRSCPRFQRNPGIYAKREATIFIFLAQIFEHISIYFCVLRIFRVRENQLLLIVLATTYHIY